MARPLKWNNESSLLPLPAVGTRIERDGIVGVYTILSARYRVTWEREVDIEREDATRGRMSGVIWPGKWRIHQAAQDVSLKPSLPLPTGGLWQHPSFPGRTFCHSESGGGHTIRPWARLVDVDDAKTGVLVTTNAQGFDLMTLPDSYFPSMLLEWPGQWTRSEYGNGSTQLPTGSIVNPRATEDTIKAIAELDAAEKQRERDRAEAQTKKPPSPRAAAVEVIERVAAECPPDLNPEAFRAALISCYETRKDASGKVLRLGDFRCTLELTPAVESVRLKRGVVGEAYYRALAAISEPRKHRPAPWANSKPDPEAKIVGRLQVDRRRDGLG